MVLRTEPVPHYDVLGPEELAQDTGGGDYLVKLGPGATKHAFLEAGGPVRALKGSGLVTLGSGEEAGQTGASLRVGPLGSLGQAGSISLGLMGSLGQGAGEPGPMGSPGPVGPAEMAAGSLEHFSHTPCSPQTAQAGPGEGEPG